MFKIENIAGKTPTANRERVVKDKIAAINHAAATSEFFHGVFEIKDLDNNQVVCYYKNGKRYNKLDTVWAA
jgi:hypothetical protein